MGETRCDKPVVARLARTTHSPCLGLRVNHALGSVPPIRILSSLSDTLVLGNGGRVTHAKRAGVKTSHSSDLTLFATSARFADA